MDEQKQQADNDSDEDYDYNDDGDIDDEEDEFENALSECGQIPGGGCMLAGTEYCDWDCPFSHELYRKRDSKGRFTK